ncbi:MAG: hypothetical protein M3R25_15910 [Bacteroidota bacterium]|nr:hypothetical protein [Bacteroidota bacterium]
MDTKLIVLPIDDPPRAQAMLKERLDKDLVIMLVMGETKLAEETARRADSLTGGIIEEPRWSIHAPVREDIMDILITLEDPNGLVTDWDKPLAIALSLTDVIRDMIVRDGTQPTFSRIEDAYINAEID